MKKGLIALIGAVAVAIPMTIASAATIEVKYDAVASTADTAVVNVYAKGFSEEEVGQLALQITYDETVVDEATAYTNRKDIMSTQLDCNPGVNKSRNSINVSVSSADYDLTWDEDEPVLTANLPLLANKAVKKFNFEYSATYSTINVKRDGAKYNMKSDVTSVPGAYLPMSATVAGTTISEDANSDAATYFTVETTGVSGATPYWYATVGGAAKKVAFTTANVEGTVTAGLVSTGSVSNAKVVWE